MTKKSLLKAAEDHRKENRRKEEEDWHKDIPKLANGPVSKSAGTRLQDVENASESPPTDGERDRRGQPGRGHGEAGKGEGGQNGAQNGGQSGAEQKQKDKKSKKGKFMSGKWRRSKG